VLSDLLFHGPVVRSLQIARSPIELHCLAIGAGYERRENETYSWEGRKRGTFALIQHTLAGRGELDYAGTHHALLPGETMVLTFPHANRYWLATGERWDYFWIGIQGREALRLVRAVIEARGPVLRLGSGAIDTFADACLALAAGDLPVGASSAAAYRAIMALRDGAFENAIPGGPEVPASIRKALALIDHDLSANLDVDRLAGAAQLSRAHFVRQFTGAVGASPSSYVLDKRMQLAERLLLATDETVASIATTCGFADGNYFAKAFRRHSGVTPSAYRATRQPLFSVETATA
jgi:AraC family transcriptional regulator